MGHNAPAHLLAIQAFAKSLEKEAASLGD